MSGGIHGLSLAGEAWWLTFTAGAVQAFIDRDAFATDVRVHGSSSGAFSAFCLFNHLDGVVPFTESAARMMRTIVDVRLTGLNPLTNVQEILRGYLDAYPIDRTAYRRLSGRMHVALTAADGSRRLVSDFTSNEDLFTTLLNSAYIPWVFSTPRRWRDLVMFDGGMTNWLYDFPGIETIKVASPGKPPFYTPRSFEGTRVHVSATMRVPFPVNVFGGIFPQLPPNKAALLGHGYEQALDFLATRPDLVGVWP